METDKECKHNGGFIFRDAGNECKLCGEIVPVPDGQGVEVCSCCGELLGKRDDDSLTCLNGDCVEYRCVTYEFTDEPTPPIDKPSPAMADVAKEIAKLFPVHTPHPLLSRDVMYDRITAILTARLGAGSDWPTLNRRRGELIDKDIDETLSDAERIELTALNAYADAYLPSRPTEELDGLEKRLGAGEDSDSRLLGEYMRHADNTTHLMHSAGDELIQLRDRVKELENELAKKDS